MKKIRCYLAAIALVITLGGSVILDMGTGSLAKAASSQHVSAAALVGKSTQAAAYRPLGWCPTAGIAC